MSHRALQNARKGRQKVIFQAVSVLRVELRPIVWNIKRTYGLEGYKWIVEGSVVCAPELIG